jgi:hypothetical protein
VYEELLPSVSDVGPGSSFPATAEPAHIFSDFPLSPFSAMTEVRGTPLLYYSVRFMLVELVGFDKTIRNA